MAELDSADAPPTQPLLIAEVDGELRVALSLRDGTVIADPFFPSTALVALLRRRAETLERRPAGRRVTLSALRLRPAA